MPWLILLAALILPFVFASVYRPLWARMGLAAVWLACAGFSVFCFYSVADLRRDLDRVDRYELPASTGDHTVPIRRRTQGSMLGVLVGGEGRPSKPELEKLRWSFPDGVAAQWFDVGQYEEVGVDEVALFRVHWPMARDPVPLAYRVGDADAAVLKSRTLLVRHDSSASHMLRDHGLPFLVLFAWASAIWAAIWLGVQVVRERKRRTVAPPGLQSF